MLPSSLPFDILPAIPMMPAAAALHNGLALASAQGEGQEVNVATDMPVEAEFGTALTELLAAVAPEAEPNELAAPAVDSVVPQPKRIAAMILPLADNPLPRSEAAVLPAAALSQTEPLDEAESVAVSVEVVVSCLVEEVVEEKVEEKEEERDEDPEAPMTSVPPPPMPVEEQRVVKAAAPVDAQKSIAEPNNTFEAKQGEPAPVAPHSPAEFQGPKQQLPTLVRRAEERAEVNAAVNAADGQRNEAAPREDISVESDAPAREQPIADIAEFKAKGSEPQEDRVTLRFRESAVSKQDRAEAAEPVERVSNEEPDANATEPDNPKPTSAATTPEIASSAPPVAHRIETRGAEIAARPEAPAADKPQAVPPEQRPQPRVSAAAAATILEKQASGAVKTVSIRLPIEDGSRAGSAVQIDVARRNSVLEVRLTGSSDGLQRAVTESIDSLVQKLAVDRWSLDAPASPGRSADRLGVPKMESILPESVESNPRPTLRMPSQEIASAAREMALEAPAQSSSGQQSSDSQRNQDFQQDSGAREHPQQQQEEQRRPRREVWGQFLQAAEEGFEAGLVETAPELQ